MKLRIKKSLLNSLSTSSNKSLNESVASQNSSNVNNTYSKTNTNFFKLKSNSSSIIKDKSISPIHNNITSDDYLNNIHIKDTSSDYGCGFSSPVTTTAQNTPQSNTSAGSVTKKNNILINISTIYNQNENKRSIKAMPCINKGFTHYHSKRKREMNEIITNKKSINDYNENKDANEDNNTSLNEILILKKKISELLEQNMKLQREKEEVEIKNKELKVQNKKLKHYVINNDIQNINVIKKEIAAYKNKINECYVSIKTLKLENQQLKEQINYHNESSFSLGN